MKRSFEEAKPALEFIEESVHLLRSSPASTLACYYLGSLPFVLGLLFFWADMSSSSFAEGRLASSSLVLALLFFWMKAWQAWFAVRLRSQINGDREPIGWSDTARLVLTQTVLHTLGLFVLPVALLVTIPFGWTFAFFQSVTAVCDSNGGRLREVTKQAFRQAFLWPRQNHLLLLPLFGFAFVVFLNWATVGFALPQLAKMLFGFESEFTRSPFSLFNTTFFASVAGLTYLSVDPLIKASYALRAFYGQARESGDDLKVELRLASRDRSFRLAAAIIMLTTLCCFGLPAELERETPPRSPSSDSTPSLDSHELGQSMREVIQQSKYAWRAPRERVATDDKASGFLGRFFEQAGDYVKDLLKSFAKWLGRMLGKLFQPSIRPSTSGTNYGWIVFLYILLYAVLAAVVVGLVWMVIKVIRNRHRKPELVATQALAPTPDLTDESIGPDHLPEDSWSILGAELLAKGELRLALRAFYLGSLALLGSRSFINLARFKSNRDYQRELQRRAHAVPELLSAFEENVGVFDRTWYGFHEASLPAVERFAQNVQQMRTLTEPQGGSTATS